MMEEPDEIWKKCRDKYKHFEENYNKLREEIRLIFGNTLDKVIEKGKLSKLFVSDSIPLSFRIFRIRLKRIVLKFLKKYPESISVISNDVRFLKIRLPESLGEIRNQLQSIDSDEFEAKGIMTKDKQLQSISLLID